MCRRDKGDGAMQAFALDRSPPAPEDQEVVDVVFVHGLTGHALKTWDIQVDKDGLTKGWVASLAASLEGQARLWSVGYAAPLFADGRTPESLNATADDALRALCDVGLGQRKVIFVAHSLGGLLVKAMLCRAMLIERGLPGRLLASNVHAVIFVGTPHTGSNLTRWRHAVPWVAKAVAAGVGVWLVAATGAAYVAALTLSVFAFQVEITLAKLIALTIVPLLALIVAMVLAPSRQVLDLDPENPALFDLTADFRRVVAKLQFSTAAFYERRHLWWFFMAVPRSSADPGLTECRLEGVDAHHIAMCKSPCAAHLAREIEQQVRRTRRGIDFAVFEDRLDLDVDTKRRMAPLLGPGSSKFVKRFADVVGDRAGAEVALRSHLRRLIAREALTADPITLALAQSSAFDIDVFVWQVWQEQRVIGVRGTLTKVAADILDTWPAEWLHKERPTLIPFYRAIRTIEHIFRGDLSVTGEKGTQAGDLATIVDRATALLDHWSPQIHGVINDRVWSLDGDAGTRRLLLRMQATLKAIAVTCEFFERETQNRHSDAQQHADQLRQLRVRFEAALERFKTEMNGPEA